MATGPKRPCQYTSCNQLVDYPDNYCGTHIPKRTPDTGRPNAYRRGYTKEWQRYRASYLANHPMCIECLKRGEMREAKVVDHIKPYKGDKQLFWERSNHQALCKRCHDKKTATKDGGFGRKIN